MAWTKSERKKQVRRILASFVNEAKSEDDLELLYIIAWLLRTRKEETSGFDYYRLSDKEFDAIEEAIDRRAESVREEGLQLECQKAYDSLLNLEEERVRQITGDRKARTKSANPEEDIVDRLTTNLICLGKISAIDINSADKIKASLDKIKNAMAESKKPTLYVKCPIYKKTYEVDNRRICPLCGNIHARDAYTSEEG